MGRGKPKRRSDCPERESAECYGEVMLPQAVVYPVAVAAAALVGWYAAAHRKPTRIVAAQVLLALYIGWIVSMTFFPLPTDPEAIRQHAAERGFRWNLVPFQTIALQAESETTWQKIRQLGGNVLVFAPFGLLLPLAAPGFARLRRVFVAGFVFSVGIELAQLAVSAALGYSYRVADIDDVILNVPGVLAGYGVYRVMRGRV